MENLITYGLGLTLFIQLLVIMYFSYKNWMEQNCLGVLSMAGCLSIASLDPFYVLKPFTFSIVNSPSTIAFKVMKDQRYKNKRKMKRGQKSKQERQSPMPKREINLKVCKLKCHSSKHTSS